MKYLRKEELSDIFEKVFRRTVGLSNSYPNDILTTFFDMQYWFTECFADAEERSRFMKNYYYACLNGKREACYRSWTAGP